MRYAAALLVVLLSGCGSGAPDRSNVERPYVVLVSLDGFRYDYAELHGAPNILRIASEGVRGEMVPSYRTNTFPNHTSLATGLYPAHHGIVDNNFYDRQRKQIYKYNAKESGGDGSWYGGTPLWVLAEQQGVRAHAMFWPATDTLIQGTRPTKYFPYDDTVPAAKRVDQVIEWSRLPDGERPHLVTLYFEHVDSAGHDYGPESVETKRAVAEIDAEMGRLYDALRAADPPANIFVVADHGMMAIGEVVRLGSFGDFLGFEISPRDGAQVMLYSDDRGAVERVYERLKDRKDPRYTVYRHGELPEHLHYNDSDRVGDIVVISNTKDLLRIDRAGDKPWIPSKGAHGYDPARFREMNALFVAAGPGLRAGLTLYPFDNVNVYPLIAEMLKLKPPDKLDGSLTVLTGALK